MGEEKEEEEEGVMVCLKVKDRAKEEQIRILSPSPRCWHASLAPLPTVPLHVFPLYLVSSGVLLCVVATQDHTSTLTHNKEKL